MGLQINKINNQSNFVVDLFVFKLYYFIHFSLRWLCSGIMWIYSLWKFQGGKYVFVCCCVELVECAVYQVSLGQCASTGLFDGEMVALVISGRAGGDHKLFNVSQHH